MDKPKNVFAGHVSELNPSLRRVFEIAGFACVPVWTQYGCSLYVHVDKDTIKGCRNALHDIKLELYEISGCPLVRFDITIWDKPHDPLIMDCFLNIQGENDKLALEALTQQEMLVFHWFDEDLKYVRSSKVSWREAQRAAAAEIISKANEIIERTGGGDFEKAKAMFYAEYGS